MNSSDEDGRSDLSVEKQAAKKFCQLPAR